MIVLVRMCELLVRMFMSVLLMRVLRGRARGVRMLMMRIVVRVRVRVFNLAVGVRMRMIGHITTLDHSLMFATHKNQRLDC